MKKCKRGHPLEGANLYVIPSSGSRLCRQCRREVHDAAARKRRRERLGLPPPDPHRGRYAIPRPVPRAMGGSALGPIPNVAETDGKANSIAGVTGRNDPPGASGWRNT